LAWSIEHRINWVEWKIRNQIALEPEPGWTERIDLEVWLARERDRLTWPQTALKFYGSETLASISKARRTFDRVQRAHPGLGQKPRRKPGPKPKARDF
jgi:hypothetical protein